MNREKLHFVSGAENEDIFQSIDIVYEALFASISKVNYAEIRIISLIFFINSEKGNFEASKQYVKSIAKDKFSISPTISIIGQSPADGSDALLEVETIYNIDQKSSVTYIPFEKDVNYTKLETAEAIEYYFYGISTVSDNLPLEYKIYKAFEILENMLKVEGIGMNNIIRQWNYVEDIVGFTSPEYGSKQNYQILNNIRHEFYGKYNFSNGFPAATGIGMSAGSFVLECVAVKEKTNLDITSIKNPLQVCAYDYSEKVLIGSKIEKSFPRLSPKFERAKLYRTDNVYSLLVSGTASIHNEVSLGIGDAGKQTEITLDNIDKLIDSASEHLKKSGKNISKVTFPYMRVYIKNPTDFQSVKNICENHTNQIDPVYLISDICREELLVEIEGVISIEIEG